MNSPSASHSYASSKTVVLALLLAVMCLGLVGCGNEMAKMKQNQASLQILVEENARQMADVVACMDRSQKELQATIASLRETTQKLSDDMTYVSNAHAELRQIVDEKNRLVAARVDSIEGNQETLRSDLNNTAQQHQRLAEDIASVKQQHLALQDTVATDNEALTAKLSTVSSDQTQLQADLATVKADILQVVTNLSAVAKAQEDFEATVNKKMDEQMAAVRQDQQKQQTEIDDAKAGIDRVTAGLTTLQASLAKLEQLMRDDAKNLSEALDLVGQRQIQSEEQSRRDIRGLTGSLDTVKQKQDTLSKQLEELRTNFDQVIKTLKSDLEQLSSSLTRITPLEIAKDDAPRPDTMQAEPNKENPDSP